MYNCDFSNRDIYDMVRGQKKQGWGIAISWIPTSTSQLPLYYFIIDFQIKIDSNQ